MDEIRMSYGSGGTTFAVTYERLGGIIGTTHVPNSSIAGIREALLELFQAAVIDGGSVPQGYNIENRKYLIEVPEFDARLERIETVNTHANISAYRTFGGLELTALRAIPAYTILTQVFFPMRGSVIDQLGCSVGTLPGTSILTTSIPNIISTGNLLFSL